jgi:hypothetical protein
MEADAGWGPHATSLAIGPARLHSPLSVTRMRRHFSILPLAALPLSGCTHHPATEAEPRPKVSQVVAPVGQPPTGQQRASPVPTAVEPLSGIELQELVVAVNEAEFRGGSLPDNILQRLKPVEVYHHLGHCVIALQRSAQEERGYYVIPLVSSSTLRDEPGWTWKQVMSPAVKMTFSGTVYEYCRKK